MKIVSSIRSSLGNEQYDVIDMDMPTPAEHELVIQVKACALSKLPAQVVSDLFPTSEPASVAVGVEVAGIVTQVGGQVMRCKEGDHVAGLLALDASYPGCAEFCIASEYNIVCVPEGVDHATAAVGVGDGLRAYTALHYQAQLAVGDTVLITAGALGSAPTLIQLAAHWGAKVLTTCSTLQEKAYLEKLSPPPAHVIEVGEKSTILVSSVLEETGGMGADIIVDSGVSLFSSESDRKTAGEDRGTLLPSKHDLISCLAVGGRWLTSHSHLQLDPPDSRQLFLRGASVSFMFEVAWTMSGSQQGRVLHILQDVLRLIAEGHLRPNISELVSLEQVPSVMTTLSPHTFGRFVMLAAS